MSAIMVLLFYPTDIIEGNFFKLFVILLFMFYLPSFRFSLRLRVLWLLSLRSLLLSLWLLNFLLLLFWLLNFLLRLFLNLFWLLFPNMCSFPNCSSSVEGVGEESVHSPTDVRTNYDLCSILSNPGLHQNKNLEWCCNNPNPGYNTLSDTNDLPKNATKSHSRKIGLHRSQEQRSN